MPISDRSRGAILSLAGVSILSMDALALRLSSTSPWIMCFWRGPFMALALFIGLRVYYGKSWVRHCRATGGSGY